MSRRAASSRRCARTTTATPGAARCSATGSTREARVAGWVHRRRDHGGLVFIDLRDRTGLVQLVFHPDESGEAFELAHRLRAEDVLTVAGDGRPPRSRDGQPGAADRRVRGPGRRGRRCSPTPRRRRSRSRASPARSARRRGFATATSTCAASGCARRSIRRHRVAAAMREFLDGEGFLEIETPMLSRSTPEGARDFLVPVAPRAGLLLRAAAVAAAVQAAADGRRVRALLPDRPLLPRRGPARRPPARLHPARHRDVVRRGRGRDRPQRAAARRRVRARRRPASSSCRCRGSPTTRRSPATAPTGPTCASGSSWSTSPTLLARDRVQGLPRRDRGAAAIVKGLNAGAREVPRSVLDGLIGRAQELGAKGLVWAFREGDGWRSPTAKFLSAEELAALNERLERRGGRPAAGGRRPAPTSPTRCSRSCGSTSPSASS